MYLPAERGHKRFLKEGVLLGGLETGKEGALSSSRSMKLSSNTEDAGVRSCLDMTLKFDSLLFVYYPRKHVNKRAAQRERK